MVGVRVGVGVRDGVWVMVGVLVMDGVRVRVGRGVLVGPGAGWVILMLTERMMVRALTARTSKSSNGKSPGMTVSNGLITST